MKNHTFANKCLIHSLVLFMVTFSIVVPMAGCGKVLQTLNTVLAKAPSVIAIVNTGLDLYNIIDPTGADPTLKAAINTTSQEVIHDLGTLVQLVSQYKADIASAPPGALAQAKEIYTLIDGSLALLTAAFHLKSAKAQAEAALIVDAVDVFLSELMSLIPPAALGPVPALNTLARSATVAVSTAKVKIISAKSFVANFNKASKKNFPQIQVALP